MLVPSLEPYALVDDPTIRPYPASGETIMEGPGILDFAFMPHFASGHPGSALIDQEIAFCRERGIAYRAFSDGDVLLI